MSLNLPRPPKHLTASTRRWFANVVAEYQLEEHHIKLLTLAAEAWDRAQEARAILGKEGLTYLNRHNEPTPRPEISVERDSAIRFSRMLRELDLNIETLEAKRPPALRSNRTLTAIKGSNHAA